MKDNVCIEHRLGFQTALRISGRTAKVKSASWRMPRGLTSVFHEAPDSQRTTQRQGQPSLLDPEGPPDLWRAHMTVTPHWWDTHLWLDHPEMWTSTWDPRSKCWKSCGFSFQSDSFFVLILCVQVFCLHVYLWPQRPEIRQPQESYFKRLPETELVVLNRGLVVKDSTSTVLQPSPSWTLHTFLLKEEQWLKQQSGHKRWLRG